VVLVEVFNDSGETPPTKVRTAIEIDFDTDTAGGPFYTIVWGTKTPDSAAICVREGEADHESVRLSEPATFFGPRGKEFCEIGDIWPKEGTENVFKLANKIAMKLGNRRRR
jgi:hypothetical protein